MRNINGTNNIKHQLACLYTKHKTQKRKIWRDGRLELNIKSSKAILHDADPPPGSGDPSLGECEMTVDQLRAIVQNYQRNNKNNAGSTATLEIERYLIEIEGPWTNPSSSATSSSSIAKRHPSRNLVSSSMKKLLTSKFQKPTAYVPPPPGVRSSRVEQVLGKRRRPLQPGELIALHYGAGESNTCDDRRRSHNNEHEQHYQPCQLHRQHNPSPMDEKNNARQPWVWPEQQRLEEQQKRHHHQPLSRQHSTDRTKSSSETFENPFSSFTLRGVESRCDVGQAGARLQHQRNVQQQRQHHLRRQPSISTSGFVRNEFDSSKYYGVEGDEAYDEWESAAPSQQPIAIPVDEWLEEQRRINIDSDEPCDIAKEGTACNGIDDERVKTRNKLYEKKMEYFKQNDAECQRQRRQFESIPKHSHNQHQQPSSLVPSPNEHNNSRNENENDFGIANSNDIRLQSYVTVQLKKKKKPKDDKFEPNLDNQNCHPEKALDVDDEEESESDDDDTHNIDGMPSSFRLKPIKPCTGTNNSTPAAMESPVAGNRLLALFGAGDDKYFSCNSGRSLYNVNNSRRAGNGNEILAITSSREEMKIDNDDIEIDTSGQEKKAGSEKQSPRLGHGTRISGFYLAPAATSSEESSDDHDSDQNG